ncbi:hypothetical protein [Pedobacter psychrophilus]|uniref:hypothetical protein n=1 Tax=Pedobacter psychrophilus TaxID=1826909 RepID=UPI00083A9D6B|nr:hypothetical protein [Pedobacter psychrophilus]
MIFEIIYLGVLTRFSLYLFVRQPEDKKDVASIVNAPFKMENEIQELITEKPKFLAPIAADTGL